ncbi:hypothetical protein ACLQ3C_15660 [Gordonia sp. DT30]|uniref:hypothetical protein n=1 Tax=Gordonia sp. DT30 TaxID=3416546 RepID=UPI003CF8F4C6
MTVWRHADWSTVAEFGADTIHFVKYPHPAASVRGTPDLSVNGIRDVDSTQFPPQIRTKGGETLFVPRTNRFALAELAARHGIPETRRPDLWSLLLDPFLDTEVTTEQIGHVDRILRAHGLTDAEIGGVRANVAEMAESYNAFMWEWTDLDLYDLICASSVWHRSEADQGRAFYTWAMELADRAGTKSGTTSSFTPRG